MGATRRTWSSSLWTRGTGPECKQNVYIFPATLLKGHGNETDFSIFKNWFGRGSCNTFEAFAIWLKICEDIHSRKWTPRYQRYVESPTPLIFDTESCRLCISYTRSRQLFSGISLYQRSGDLIFFCSVADPVPGSSVFLAPGYRSGFRDGNKSGFRDQHPESYSIVESLVIVFGLKILKFFVANLDPGSDASWIWDLGWKYQDPG